MDFFSYLLVNFQNTLECGMRGEDEVDGERTVIKSEGKFLIDRFSTICFYEKYSMNCFL
jgi:hypothetical protein